MRRAIEKIYTYTCMTLYLKYRPQKISELDLTSVRDMLGNILKSKTIPHAFLFAGPRGTGKTSAARILAKVVNNDENIIDSADVIELDAASNRGIDEIRTLRELIALTPMGAKFKIYIIDEVHMLTNEAFNALLKTLEEPPPHAVFVLCTTEIEKLPETIVSRCMLVKFARPSVAEIVEKLKIVAKGEKLKMDNAVPAGRQGQLTMIATAAKGSFRDAIKILEQVVASGQPVQQFLGMLESADPSQFVQLLKDNQTQPALEMITKLVDQGGSVRGFIERCVEELREQLLAGQSDLPAGRQVLGQIEAFEKAYMRTRDAAVPQLPLEILVIENSKTRAAGIASGDARPELQNSKSLEPRTQNLAPSHSKSKFKLEDVIVKWPEILKAVRPKNHSVEALLRSTRPVDIEGSALILEVFYKFHKDKLESQRCREIVEQSIGDVLNTDPIRVELRLGQKSKKEEVSAETIEEDIVKAAEEIFKVDAI